MPSCFEPGLTSCQRRWSRSRPHNNYCSHLFGSPSTHINPRSCASRIGATHNAAIGTGRNGISDWDDTCLRRSQEVVQVSDSLTSGQLLYQDSLSDPPSLLKPPSYWSSLSTSSDIRLTQKFREPQLEMIRRGGEGHVAANCFDSLKAFTTFLLPLVSAVLSLLPSLSIIP